MNKWIKLLTISALPSLDDDDSTLIALFRVIWIADTDEDDDKIVRTTALFNPEGPGTGELPKDRSTWQAFECKYISNFWIKMMKIIINLLFFQLVLARLQPNTKSICSYHSLLHIHVPKTLHHWRFSYHPMIWISSSIKKKNNVWGRTIIMWKKKTLYAPASFDRLNMHFPHHHHL